MTYYTSPVMTEWQRQIILGTILGGSSIVKPKRGKNSYLFMRSKDHAWVAYKAEELKGFSSQRPFTEEGNTLRWHSNCFPIFNSFRETFYGDGKKKIKMSILDIMKDIGLAVWYGDCGKIRKGRVYLNTHKFGLESTKIAVKYFNEIGIPADVAYERNNLRVTLTPEGSQRFLVTIAHRLPDFMHKKLEG